MYRLALAVVFTLPLAAPAAVYKYVDDDGNVVYSDQRREGAEQVDLPESSVYKAPETPELGQEEQAAGQADQPAAYESVAVAEPANDATVWNVNGVVKIQVDLQPGLKEGHQVGVLLDDAPLGKTAATTSFQLEGVERGTHTVAVRVVGPDGQPLAKSETVTFHMKRHTVPKDQRNSETGRQPYLPPTQAPSSSGGDTSGSPASGTQAGGS